MNTPSFDPRDDPFEFTPPEEKNEATFGLLGPLVAEVALDATQRRR